jgi:hypothetical protein
MFKIKRTIYIVSQIFRSRIFFGLILGVLISIPLTALLIFSTPPKELFAQTTTPWSFYNNPTFQNSMDIYYTSPNPVMRLKTNGETGIRRIYDLDDASNTYNLDPSAESRVNGIYGRYFRSSINDSWLPYPGNNVNYLRGPTAAFTSPWVDENELVYQLDPNGTSILKYVYINSVAVQRLSDWDNGAYNLDLNGASRLNTIYPNSINCLGPACPAGGGVLFATPHVHMNSPANYGVFVNWNNGTPAANGGAVHLAVGNGLGAYAMYVRANGYVGMGSYGGLSDERIKKNIEPISQPLEKLLALDGIEFEFTNQNYPNMTLPEGKNIGFVAQQIEKIVPEVVVTGENGLKSVSYQNLTALIVEGVKDQQNQLNTLKTDFSDLKFTTEGEIETLKARLDYQEQKNNSQDQDIQNLKKELEELKNELSQLKQAR